MVSAMGLITTLVGTSSDTFGEHFVVNCAEVSGSKRTRKTAGQIIAITEFPPASLPSDVE